MLSKQEKLTICRFLDQRFSKLKKLPESVKLDEELPHEIKKRHNLLDYELAKMCSEKLNMKLNDVIEFLKNPDFNLRQNNNPEITSLSKCTHIAKKDQSTIVIPSEEYIKLVLITRTHLTKSKFKIKEESILISKEEYKNEREKLGKLKVPVKLNKRVFTEIELFNRLSKKYEVIVERDSEIPIGWEEYQLEFEIKNKAFISDSEDHEWIDNGYSIYDNRPRHNKKISSFTSLYLTHLDKENRKTINTQLTGIKRH